MIVLKNKSLKFTFQVSFLLLAVVAGVIVPGVSGKLSLNAFRAYWLQQRNANLENLGESLTALYDEEGHTWKRRRVMDILHPAPQWIGMKITLIDDRGREVFTLRPMQSNSDREMIQEHITIPLGHHRHAGTLEIEHRMPARFSNHSFVSYLTRYILIGSSIIIVLACGLGYYVAGRLSRPVIRAIERTKSISRGEYDSHETQNPSGIRELDALTRGVEDLGRSLATQEKLRQRLMTDIAHELRTPLTVAMSQIEAISDGILEPAPERLALCMNEMKRLGGLIANVEALSRLEGDASELRTVPVKMKDFLEPVLESFGPVFARSGISFAYELEDGIACEIDPGKFRHVIDNLLSNALRYTNPKGNVDVSLSRESNNAVIKVSDDGIGISEKDLPNIFERFYRADESRARVTGGSGVGLAIVKAAVEAHGGKITASSIKDKGSCFRIELPLYQSS